jgi:anti-sigma factor RsiW
MPDWGQDHLSPEAVVAFVDDELDDGPFLRATRHLDSCPECATQVAAQGQARSALRSAECPSLPSSLMSSLFSIPHDTEVPGAPAGLAVTAEGEFVSVLRPERVRQEPPAGLALDHGRRVPARRMRFGAGAAMSGLALGAMALGATGISSDAPTAVAGPDRGVFDGSVLGGSAVDAQLRIPATAPGAPSW